MIYEQYRFLLNHSSHKINLITNSPNTFVYRIQILTESKKLYFMNGMFKKVAMKIVKLLVYFSSIPTGRSGNTLRKGLLLFTVT